jgi:putative aldouronate transport system permease protein
LKLLFSFPVPIVLALLLNEFVNPSYKRTIQTIIYLPHFISWVIIGGILFNLLSVNYGVVNNVLQLAGQEPIFFMASKKWFRPLLVITTIWKNAGWGTIIYLAALSSVNPELYEAAVMDGAGKLRQMWSITLPGIRATIIVMFIIALSRLMNAGFNQVIVLYNSMVMQVGDIIDTYVYRSGMQLGRFSYASVVGLFKGAVGFILILSADLVAKRVFHERGII